VRYERRENKVNTKNNGYNILHIDSGHYGLQRRNERASD